MIIPVVGHVSEPQKEDQLQTLVILNQGSQEEEAIISKYIIVNFKKTEEQSCGNVVDNTNMGDQDRLDKDRSYENLVDNTNVGNPKILDKTILRTHLIMIQPAPRSRGPGSNHKLYRLKDNGV